jgi:ABC-2 type transport system ATP-binding protein
MRMITGFIPPTEGRVTIGGHDIVDQPIAARRLIGYLPENAPAYTDMTVGGFLNFAAELRGLRGDAKTRAVSRAIEMCFLENVVHQSVDTLSKGYRHRTSLAQSIIHDPEVLILDEPTDGLDPNQKHEVRGLIKRMGEKKAIIFSTHILEEVEAACTRAIIIDRGKVVANGTPAELLFRSENAGAVSLKVSGAARGAVSEKLAAIGKARKTVIVSEEGALIWAKVLPKGALENGELARAVAEVAFAEKWKVEELRTEHGRLDEVFRNITSSDVAKEAA